VLLIVLLFLFLNLLLNQNLTGSPPYVSLSLHSASLSPALLHLILFLLLLVLLLPSLPAWPACLPASPYASLLLYLLLLLLLLLPLTEQYHSWCQSDNLNYQNLNLLLVRQLLFQSF